MAECRDRYGATVMSCPNIGVKHGVAKANAVTSPSIPAHEVNRRFRKRRPPEQCRATSSASSISKSGQEVVELGKKRSTSRPPAHAFNPVAVSGMPLQGRLRREDGSPGSEPAACPPPDCRNRSTGPDEEGAKGSCVAEGIAPVPYHPLRRDPRRSREGCAAHATAAAGRVALEEAAADRHALLARRRGADPGLVGRPE